MTHVTSSLPLTPTLPPAHPRGLIVATVLALALHAALLLRWPAMNLQARAGAALGTIDTRIIAPTPAPTPAPTAPPEEVEEPVAEPSVPTPAAEARPTTPKPRRAARPRPAAPTAEPAATPSRGASGGVMDPTASLLSPPSMGEFGGSRSSVPLQAILEGEAGEQALQFAASGEAVPATVPRGATLQYQARGSLEGVAAEGPITLSWRRAADFYEADWESSRPALASIRLSSIGLLGPQGLVPVQAGPRTGGAEPIRFDYAGRTVHLVPPAPQAPLTPGTQDELSAIVQVGAWLAADPDRFAPGQTFELPTASRQAVQPARWLVEGRETITALGDKPIDVVKLTRLALDPSGVSASARIEVWLAPALDYLPARVRLNWPDGSALDATATSARLNRNSTAPAAAPASAAAR